MEAKLAAAHPDIKTYAGRGIDDPTATVRADISDALGFHASVRSPDGAWYVDPSNRTDDSVYLSYFARDLSNDEAFAERGPDGDPDPFDLGLGKRKSAAAGPSVQLRTYRLALVTDPAYAAYFGGSANVTAAKVALMNRVDQIYEDETAIRLVLIGDNDKPNLDTAAQMTGANGPCGSAACFTAAQASTCAGATLDRNRIVIGQIIGAANYDVGHIALGVPGGGVASLGVIGAIGQGARLHRPRDPGRRLLRRRLRGARDGPPVRRQPHVQRHAAQLLGRQPQRGHLGRAGLGLVDHGLRGHLRPGQPAAALGPVLVPAQLRRDHGARHRHARGGQRGPERLAAGLRRRGRRDAVLQGHERRPVHPRRQLHRGRHPGRALGPGGPERHPGQLRHQRRLLPAHLPGRLDGADHPRPEQHPRGHPRRAGGRQRVPAGHARLVRRGDAVVPARGRRHDLAGRVRPRRRGGQRRQPAGRDHRASPASAPRPSPARATPASP